MSRVLKVLLVPAIVLALLEPATIAARASTPPPTGGVTGPIAVAANGAALIYTVRWTCHDPEQPMWLVLRQVRPGGGVTVGTQPLTGLCDGTTQTMHAVTVSDIEVGPNGTSLPYVRPWSAAPVLTALTVNGSSYRVIRPTVADPQRPVPQARILSVKVVARAAALAVTVGWQCPASHSISYYLTAVQRVAGRRVQSASVVGSLGCKTEAKTTTVLIPATTDSFGALVAPWRTDNSVLLMPSLYCDMVLCSDGWQIIHPR